MGRDPSADGAARAVSDVRVEDYVRTDGTIVIPDGITLTSFLTATARSSATGRRTGSWTTPTTPTVRSSN